MAPRLTIRHGSTFRRRIVLITAVTLGAGSGFVLVGRGTNAAPEPPGESSSAPDVAAQAPTIVYAVDRPPDEADDDVPAWYRAPVTFRFTCDDADSAVAICPIPAIFTSDGIDLVTAVAALDTEGHSTIVITPPINLDPTPPAVRLLGIADGDVLTVAPQATCEASDLLSGLVRTCSVGGAAPLGGGWYAITAEAKDRAGNVSRTTARYRLDPAPADGLVAVLESFGDAPITEVFFGFDVTPADDTSRVDRTLTAPARPGRPDHLGTFVVPGGNEVSDTNPLADGQFACSAPLDPLVAGALLVSDFVASNGNGFGGVLRATAGPIEDGARIDFSGDVGPAGSVLAGRLSFIAAAASPCGPVVPPVFPVVAAQ